MKIRLAGVFISLALFSQPLLAGNNLKVTLTDDSRYVSANTTGFYAEPESFGAEFVYWAGRDPHTFTGQDSTVPGRTSGGATTFRANGAALGWQGCSDGSGFHTSRYDISFTVNDSAALIFNGIFQWVSGGVQKGRVTLYIYSDGVRVLTHSFDAREAASLSINDYYALEPETNYRLIVDGSGSADFCTESLVSYNLGLAITSSSSVTIDVLPGDSQNIVYPNRSGKLPVAILSATDFDATQANPATLRFGLGEATIAETVSVTDVDGQNGPDTVARFHVEDSGILCNDTEVTLTGMTYADEPFVGTDSIDASDCEDGGCHAY